MKSQTVFTTLFIAGALLFAVYTPIFAQVTLTTDDQEEPVAKIMIDKGVAFYHEPVAIEASNLRAEFRYDIELRLYDVDSNYWKSTATYISDRNGRINLDVSPSVAGSYLGIQPMGLFWSLVSDDSHQISTSGVMHGVLSLKRDDQVLSSVAIKRLSPRDLNSINVDLIRVREEFIADVYVPRSAEKIPVIIYLGGSGGGFRQERSSLLASEGYAVVNLKYFRYEGLPDGIIEIPLEYVHAAYEWIVAQGVFDTERIGIIGRSRGSELALLYAANYHVTSFVIAEAPSSVVWFGWEDGKSSWTHKGLPIPYAEYEDSVSVRIERGFEISGVQYHDGPKFLSAFTDIEMIDRSTIPIEKIACPMLFVSGSDDQTWPSSMMSARMVERLVDNKFGYEFQHIEYPNAGHNFGGGRQGCGIPYLPPEDYSNSSAKGGTVAGNALAAIKSWQDELLFIRRHFNEP